MRDYGIVSARFWIGDTGKALRQAGRDCQVIAMYLLTCPNANMIGLYYLPLPTLCHETGIPIAGASKALQRVCELGFAHYDEASEYVYVPNMAKWQVGASLKDRDKRRRGVANEFARHANCPFALDFWREYAGVYGLDQYMDEPSSIEAPCKPHRSQDQDQDQDQDQEKENPPCIPPSKKKKAKRTDGQADPSLEWPAELDSPEIRSLFADYVANRKDMRKPMTPRSQRMALKQLAQLGPERARVALIDTIARGWQGITFTEAREREFAERGAETVEDDQKAPALPPDMRRAIDESAPLLEQDRATDPAAKRAWEDATGKKYGPDGKEIEGDGGEG